MGDQLLPGATILSAMRTSGVEQPDKRSCISSCIATFLGHTELRNPLKKVGRRHGNLVDSDNDRLRPLGCEIKKLSTPEIPMEESSLVLATRPCSKDGHCFLFKDGALDWDPSPPTTWPDAWQISEVWEIKLIAPQTSQQAPARKP